jgi:hypothetical protein
VIDDCKDRRSNGDKRFLRSPASFEAQKLRLPREARYASRMGFLGKRASRSYQGQNSLIFLL